MALATDPNGRTGKEPVISGSPRLAIAALVVTFAVVLGGCGIFGGDDGDEETTQAEEATIEEETTSEAQATEDAAAETEETAGDTEAGEIAAENEAATAEETAQAEGVTTTTPGVVTTTTTDPVTGEAVVTTTPATTTATTTATGTVYSPSGATPVGPVTAPATQVPPVRSGNGTNVQAGLSMIPGLGAANTFPRFFSAGSPWNTDVSREPVDGRSQGMIEQAEFRPAVIEDADGTLRRVQRRVPETGLTVNTTRWTVPLFSEQGGEPTVAVCRQAECGPDEVGEITIPAAARPDPRFDGWMTVIDTQERIARDFWRARREQDGSISYHFVKAWDLNGPGFQEPGGVSARGSGLPLFAGLIRPEEIDRGRIDHALAISIPGAAKERFVQPASRTDGVGRRSSVPEGARLRLRFRNSEDFINRVCPPEERARKLAAAEAQARARNRQLTRDQNRELNARGVEARNLARARARILAEDLARARRRPCGLAGSPEAQLTDIFVRNDVQRRTAQVIIEALKHYGAIVVDRSASPTLYAQRNARWKKILPPNLIQDIKLEQFEVLELPPILNDPGSFTLIDPLTGLPTAAPSSIAGGGVGVDGATPTTTPTTTTGTTTTEEEGG